MTDTRFDMRKQRIFIALDGRQSISLDGLASAAAVTRQFAARELKRLGWRQRDTEYRRPQHGGAAR